MHNHASRTWSLWLSTALASTALFPAMVQAQDAIDAQPEIQADIGNEIVVTALRRDTTLQDTPISISAITGEGLTKIGATSVNDYFRQIPNLQVEGNAPASRRISIRGVRSAGEATVGLYYDETPLTGPGGTTADAGSTNPDINLFDVERVEVLRGPQGTLFGSGSMGGTIRLIFNKPNSQDFEGAVELQGTVTKNGEPGFYAKGMVNVPVATDKMAVRIIGYKENRGGFIDAPALGREDINGTRSFGGRIMVGFTPSETLTLVLSANYQKNKLLGPFTFNNTLGAYNSDVQAIAASSDELQLYNATATWELPFATLTATASHYNWDILRNQDYTSVLRSQRANATSCRNYIGIRTACNASQLAQYGSYVDSRLPGLLYQPLSLQAWTFEGRLTGALLDDRLDYTVGVFHDQRLDTVDSQVVRADATGSLITPLDLTAWRQVATDQSQLAFFGELSFKPIDALTLTAGARRFSYDKVVGGQVLQSNFITQSYVGPYSEVDASAKGWVSKFNISYEFDRNVMTYVSASKGFRPGGANNVPGLGSGLVSYQPDSLWNYELGMKTQWFGNMFTLNGAIYQIDWNNMQISGRSANGAFSFLTNAGAARLRGGELEATLRPMPGLSFSSALGYVDAKLTEAQVNDGLAATGTTGLKGDRIPNIPRFTAAVNVEYNWDIADGLRGMARADVTHSAGSYSEFRPTYVYYERNPAYQNVSLRLGIETDSKLIVQVYVQNLLNETDPVLLQSSAFGLDQALTLQPRTFGVMVRKAF